MCEGRAQLNWMDNPMDIDEMRASFPCAGDEEAPLCDTPVQCTAGYRTCGQCPHESYTLDNWREQMCDVGLLKQCAGDHCTCGAPGPGCSVGEWSEWSACDVPCGGGVQQRARDVARDAGVAPEACAYAASQSQSCNSRPCQPVDCVVGEWSAWGACACGEDAATPTQARTRPVLQVAVDGGAECPATTEQRACESGSCSTPCQVSEWGAWGSCSAPCGGGVTTRSRTVLVEGSGACSEALTEDAACNEAACPVSTFLVHGGCHARRSAAGVLAWCRWRRSAWLYWWLVGSCCRCCYWCWWCCLLHRLSCTCDSG